MDGLKFKQEKPSNTEVLGLLMDDDKLKYITNLNMQNIKGLCKLRYLTQRLKDPDKDPIEIHDEVLEDYLALKCSMQTKKGNRTDQVVDALKGLNKEEEDQNSKSLVDQIKK